MLPHRFAPVLLLALLWTSAARAQDALVVAPDDLRPGLDAWLEHRAAQGAEIAVLAPGEDLQTTIRAAHDASDGRLSHVLLVGDVDRVPCAYRAAVAIAPWEKDDRIATDAPLVDLDGDDVPDLAVGRVPAATAEEARALLARSIAYETTAPRTDWPRHLGIVAGVGGFGAQQDMALEMLTRLVLNQDVPEGVVTRMTYAKETSAFCPPPDALQDTMLDTVGGGALAVAYVGHGSARHVDRMAWQGRRWPILEASAVSRLNCRAGPPLLIFVACSTGQYDAAQESLAELALRHADGPAAVIASSRVSTPYGNGLLAVELLDALYRGEDATAGGVLLAAKRRLISGEGGPPTRRTVEAMAGSFYEPDPERRARDRLEHAWLYQLFGDPMLRLRRPAAVSLTPPSTLTAGATAEIAIRSPVAGRVVVELCPRRDAHARPRRPGRTAEQMRSDHARANAGPLATAGAEAAAGSTTVIRLEVPGDVADGRYVLRVWVTGAGGDAMGGASVRVEAPR